MTENKNLIVTFIGAQNTGKSTTVKDLFETLSSKSFSTFVTPKLSTKNYRDIIKENNLKFNEEGNIYSQRMIFNALKDEIDECINYSPTQDNKLTLHILDRSPIDALVYTKYLYENKVSDVTFDDVVKMYKETVEYCKKLDYIFYIPIYECRDIKLVPDGFRSLNPEYREKIGFMFDNNIKALNFLGKIQSFNIFGKRDVRIDRVIKIISRNYPEFEVKN